MHATPSPDTWYVMALYRFVDLQDLPTLQASLKAKCLDLGICGTILLAPEGINGTIAGRFEAITEIEAFLNTHCGLSQGEVKYSTATEKPFRRMKVQLKKEIITMRTSCATPTERVGTYIEPKDWNAIISDPDVLVLDTRNDYEVAIGTFKNAVNPNISVFTEFVPYVQEHLNPQTHKKVAMFCTGGIRCEKASSFMLNQGFETVYHLKGGILKYLEEAPKEESLWEGACFVFDRRVGVEHGLQENNYSMCFNCGWPLTQADRDLASYEEGVSCVHCIDSLTEEKAQRLRMRQQQIESGLFA